MDGRVWIFGLMPVMVLYFTISVGAFAVPVESFGVVSNLNPQAGTLTITVNKASKGLQDRFGEDVTFHTSNAMRINTCSIKTHTMSGCWNQLSQNVGNEGREADRAERKAELSLILESGSDEKVIVPIILASCGIAGAPSDLFRKRPSQILARCAIHIADKLTR